MDEVKPLEYGRARAGSNSEKLVSWLALVLALTCCAAMGVYIPIIRERYAIIFHDFRIKAPPTIEVALCMPAAAVWAITALLALIAIAIHFIIESRVAATLFQILIMLVCIITFLAYREAISGVMTTLVHGVSGASSASP